MPTLPKGQMPAWSDLRLKHRMKLNKAGAQVAMTILLAASFMLIKPVGEAWASNPVYVAMSAIVVAEPNQTASVRLFAQRLIGVTLSGAFSILILYLDSILPPQGCLHCSWKPYTVAIIIFIFFYFIVTVRETVPAQAYTSKMVDLTFLITFLAAYDDQRNGVPWDNYAPAFTRLGSVALGILLTMIGAFLFWPVRVSVVHRVITGNLFKDFSSFLYDVLREGYLHPSVRLPPDSVAIRIEDVDSDSEEDVDSPIGRDRVDSNILKEHSDRTNGVVVTDGMEVLGSQNATTAETMTRPPKKKWHPNMHQWKKKKKKVYFRNLTGSAQESDEEEDDGVLTATRFRSKIHPAAVKILRTLEKERARLEASYQVEFRAIALYGDRLVELRGLAAESRQNLETTTNPFWHAAWVDDTTALTESFPAPSEPSPPTASTPTYSYGTQPPFPGAANETDECFDLAKYVSSLCVTLMDLGDITLATTSRARAVPVGAAELCARLEVVTTEVGRARENLEAELMRIRKLINVKFEMAGAVPI
ncbi:hypothetical protein HK097_001060, partial [Rhizophlyctis rosea]